MSEKHDAMWGEAGEEIASLRAEIARLMRLNEKLGAFCDLQIDHRIEQINRLESYNAKLRAALEGIQTEALQRSVAWAVLLTSKALANEQEGK